jgi:RNA polymerase sigma-70 factor (ECF subfamily)
VPVVIEQPGSADFITALQAHQGILYKVARTCCNRAEEHADLIQDMILELWRAWPRFDARARFSTWMYKIAMNVAISLHRSQQRRPTTTADLSLSLGLDLIAAERELVSGDDDLHALLELLKDFETIDRALVLLYLEGYAHAELAELTGLNAGTVAVRIHRIKQRLLHQQAQDIQP